MPWEHRPHLRVLAAGLIKDRSPPEGHSEGRSTKSGSVEGSSASLLPALISKVAEMMMMEVEEVSADVPLGQLGLDSLVAVELRNWIRREGKVELPLTKVVGAKNLRALVEYVTSK